MRWSFVAAVILALGAFAFVVNTEAPIEDPVWWYGNETPPSLSIQGSAGPLRGSTEAAIVLAPLDRARIVDVTLDGQPLSHQGARLGLETSTLADGSHRVVVTARDTSRRQNEATATWTFQSDNTGPVLDVQADPSAGPVEGHTFVVRVRAVERVQDLQATLEGRPLLMQAGDGPTDAWALAGVPPEPAYRALRLVVSGQDALGNGGSWEHVYPLTLTRFPSEVLDLTAELENLTTPTMRGEEEARLLPIYEAMSGPPRWSGRFQVPVDGPITTEFATKRTLANGRLYEEYHPGVDFGVGLGEPVRAPADGVVAFAATVPLRGNALILDHGAGVFSTYGHLQRFEVRQGESVKAGQVIARVGSTGLSTGPHLHWEIWVDGAVVDPLEWTERTFP